MVTTLRPTGARSRRRRWLLRRTEFETLVDRFVQEHLKENCRLSHAIETERLLRRDVLPPWRGRAIASITRADITALLKGVRKRAPVLANRVRAAISKLFSWALEEGLVDQSPMIGVPHATTETSRDRVLDDGEIARIWRAAGKLDTTGQAFVRLLILTAARRGEVAGMMWSEIDLAAKTWVLEAERAKNDQPHLIPLVDEAIEILKGVPKVIAPGAQAAKFVLTISGYRGLSAFSALKREIDGVLAKDGGEPMARWTWHDCRRSVATGLARLRTAPWTIEALLNHRSGVIKGVARRYNLFAYDPEKRAALSVWAAHLSAILEGRPAANVVPLARA